MATPVVFTGTTITFSGGFFTGTLLELSWSGIERAALEISNSNQVNLGTPIYGRQFTPGKLYDPGEIVLRLLFDETMTPPIVGAAETITVTFPSANTWAASGFLTQFETTGQVDDLFEARATLKLSGNVTF